MSSTSPTVITESLGGSRLAQSAIVGQLEKWYPAVPRDREAWPKYAAEVAASVNQNWLDTIRPAINPSGAARDRLEQVAKTRGIVVTTGQQPGLFGGALLTLVKALSARAVADAIHAQTGVATAPVFWAATDDADFVEASGVTVVRNAAAELLSLTETAPAGTPMSAVPLSANVAELFQALSESCGSAPDRHWLSMVEAAYRAPATIGSAYVQLLRGILEPLGIAVLDASHPAVTDAAAPVLRRALTESRAVADALHRRTEEIRAGGFSPQVEEMPNLALVFVNENGVKRRVPIGEAKAAAGGLLSATVLTRPIVERAILPTACYLGGPGEVAYFAQISAVAQALGAVTPRVMPRWSCTIIEPRIQELLGALNLYPEDLADPHAAERSIAKRRMPAALAQTLTALKTHIKQDVDRLGTTSEELVPQAVIEGLKRNIMHRLERVERRFEAGVKRRETEAMRRVALVRASLYPNGVRQERKLSYIPFLARHGQALIDDMSAHALSYARATLFARVSLTTPPLPMTAVR